MSADPAVLLRKVTKRFGSTTALDDVSFEIHRGEMFGLIGPDGAGKTTAIRVMCGLVPAEEGEIRVLGRDPRRNHRALTGVIGYLSQRFSLYGDLSIDENIAFFAEIHGVSNYRARRERLLELTRLTPFRRRRADRLSGGMKQKLALACTLVHEPDVILLDEPTTGVDPVSRREFWKLLSEFLSQGLTIVMATPYLDEAERCARVALLNQGRLLALDEPKRLQARFTDQLYEVIATPHRAAYDAIGRVPGITDRQTFGERLHVRVAPDARGVEEQIRQALAANHIDLTSIRRVPPSLEDVFIDRIHAASPPEPGARPVMPGASPAAPGE